MSSKAFTAQRGMLWYILTVLSPLHRSTQQGMKWKWMRNLLRSSVPRSVSQHMLSLAKGCQGPALQQGHTSHSKGDGGKAGRP